MSMSAPVAALQPAAQPPAAAGSDAAPLKRDGPIPVTLKLGEFELELLNGQWAGTRPSDAPAHPVVDARELTDLQHQLRELKDKLFDAEQEKNMLFFKNRLLIEMLAVSQLDCKKRDEELAAERLRVEALKWRITMDRRAALES